MDMCCVGWGPELLKSGRRSRKDIKYGRGTGCGAAGSSSKIRAMVQPTFLHSLTIQPTLPRRHTHPAFLSRFARLLSPGLQCFSFLWTTKVKASAGSLDLQPLPALTYPHATS